MKAPAKTVLGPSCFLAVNRKGRRVTEYHSPALLDSKQDCDLTECFWPVYICYSLLLLLIFFRLLMLVLLFTSYKCLCSCSSCSAHVLVDLKKNQGILLLILSTLPILLTLSTNNINFAINFIKLILSTFILILSKLINLSSQNLSLCSLPFYKKALFCFVLFTSELLCW